MNAQPGPIGARWFAVGALLGLLASGLLIGGWHRSSSGLSVSVLGAGRQASVLITADHRRILIAAGTNAATFSNALAETLPPVDSELDLVLIDPAASVDVRDRVRSLEASVTWSLPERGEAAAADTVQRSFTVDFDDRNRLRLIVTQEGDWLAVLESSAGRVLISTDSNALTSTTSGAAVVILTHEEGSVEFNVPLIITLPGTTTATGEHRVARPGSVVRLDVLAREIRTDAA